MPTYNNARYIGHAIRSVLAQSISSVEIVVLDGGSNDNTADVVTKLATSFPVITYVRQETKGGIDQDMAAAVQIARGTYCWLLSADDAFAEGSVQRILAECEEGFDILLANRMWCDVELNPIVEQKWLADGVSDAVFDLQHDTELRSFLRRARSLGAIFSFMSAIGFRRNLWRDVSDDATHAVGTNYAHVHRLFTLARRGAKLKYLATPLVLCRSGNDSFATGGLMSRLTIDLAGYLELSRTIFPNAEELQKEFRAVLRREHSWRVWMYLRESTSDKQAWRRLENLLKEYGFWSIQLAAIRGIAVISKMRRRLLQRDGSDRYSSPT